MGVWIEICDINQNKKTKEVTPLVGVWIEMAAGYATAARRAVTPLVGVWIEIGNRSNFNEMGKSHSPCGSVD